MKEKISAYSPREFEIPTKQEKEDNLLETFYFFLLGSATEAKDLEDLEAFED